jgi:glycosyltransferase involved in cell wall biosynthesis
MHVLHAIDTLRTGGAQQVLVEIANQTIGAGAAVSVCVTRGGCDMAVKLKPGIDVYVLGRTSRFDWAAMRRLAGWVKRHNVDLIHSHGRTTFSLLAFMKTLGLIHAPLVMHDHSGIVEEGDASASAWFRVVGRRYAAQYVGVCEAAISWAEGARVPGARRRLIPNGLDLHRDTENAVINIREEFNAAPGVLLGICLGGVRPQKGIDTLLAAATLSRRRGAYRIVVVGGIRDASYWEHCLREAKRLGLGNEVVFAGERADVHGWLGQFDFAVHAARSESGPLVVIEHLAAGLPLVCTRVGGISRRAEELGAERFVPPEDPAALAGAIDEVVAATPRARLERARRGKEIAFRHFDIRAVMPAWRDVYERALAATA